MALFLPFPFIPNPIPHFRLLLFLSYIPAVATGLDHRSPTTTALPIIDSSRQTDTRTLKVQAFTEDVVISVVVCYLDH